MQVVAQNSPLPKIEPLFWYAEMQNPDLQLIVHHPSISKAAVKVKYAGVKLKKVHQVENPNYLFIDLHISKKAKPGKITITFEMPNQEVIHYPYELKPRNKGTLAQGVTTKDFIYLIMPDRFANGNPANDQVDGLREQEVRRDSMYARHGGDIEGIINKLDYLQDLGVTTLWLNPVITNDMPTASYHGYAQTEHYHVDPRLGGDKAYLALSDELHKRGMKLIKDIVHNHVGLNHWTILDMPFKEWVNQWPTYTNTSYKDQTLFDPYAADIDRDIMERGWFVSTMPDLNQRSSFVRNYITQSHIWWIEYAGIDGFRLDTYAYNDLEYMAEWAKKIKTEYPQFTFFGETWVHGLPNQAVYLKGNKLNQGIDTGLEGVTDFQLHYAIIEAMNSEFGWMSGVNKLYSITAADYMYEDPTKNVIFLDNHDISRFFSVVHEDLSKYKSALTWLMTYRGIPQLYYGAEIGMKNLSNPDGLVREDFPGGWQGDTVNKFDANGRTSVENEIHSLVKKLARYRQQHAVLATGKFMHYVPENGIYVYFRYDDDKTVMVVMNTSSEEKELPTARFEQRMKGFNKAVNIVSEEKVDQLKILHIPSTSTQVFELLK
jgi:glycosidase